MVHVASPATTMPPIQQIVSRIDQRAIQSNCLPRLDALAQAGTVQELPFGVDESPLTGEHTPHIVQCLNAKLSAG